MKKTDDELRISYPQQGAEAPTSFLSCASCLIVLRLLRYLDGIPSAIPRVSRGPQTLTNIFPETLANAPA